jgi:hypothetical protein
LKKASYFQNTKIPNLVYRLTYNCDVIIICETVHYHFDERH